MTIQAQEIPVNIFRVFLILAWLVIATVTVNAIAAQGFEGGMVFFSDFGHPWRGQINTDFSIHILLLASWMMWRENSKIVGSICAIGAVLGGSSFTLLYILSATYRAKGSIKATVLGAHAIA